MPSKHYKPLTFDQERTHFHEAGLSRFLPSVSCPVRWKCEANLSQHVLQMPDEDSLRNLPTYSDRDHRPSFITPKYFDDLLEPRRYPTICSEFRGNGSGGIFVGTTAAGNHVWAALVESGGNWYWFDAPGRAVVVLYIVHDNRHTGDPLNVVFTHPTTMEEVAIWDAAVEGVSMKERFCCIYDALREDAFYHC